MREQNQEALSPEHEEEAQCKGQGRTTETVTSQLSPCGLHVVKDPLFLGKLSKERRLLLAAARMQLEPAQPSLS